MRILIILFALIFELNAMLLLSEFNEKKLDSSLDSYLVSEKFDGIRAFFDAKNLLSRNKNIINLPACKKKLLPPFSIDGELFIDYESFENLVSLVNTKNTDCKDWDNVKYLIFDLPECEKTFKKTSCESLDSRLKLLHKWLDENKDSNQFISVIKQVKLESKQQLDSMLRNVVNRGGEGLVIRKNKAPYEYGRSLNAFKLKPFLDAECKVIEHIKGRGKFSDKLGSILCEQQIESGVIYFKIGSGFSNLERENPPKIGSIITYKYNGKTKNGIPKFATFLRIKNN